MFGKKLILGLEFVMLCLAVPGYIIIERQAPYMFSFLWAASLYTFIVYRVFLFDGWKKLWRWDAVTIKNLRPILARWILACVAMIAFTYFYAPGRLFFLPRENPEIIPFILILYPVISALPQEFIFCSYFFKRYAPFFGQGRVMVAASAVVFAYVHILYINPVAPVRALQAGLSSR